MAESNQMKERYKSTLIPQSKTVNWRICNVTQLLKNSAFSAMRIPMVVGWGPVSLTDWELSLHSTSTMLQMRVKLLTISTSNGKEGISVPHHLTTSIRRRGKFSRIQNPKEFQKCQEATVCGPPTIWNLLPLEDLEDIKSGIVDINDDDAGGAMEFEVELTTFGQDLSLC